MHETPPAPEPEELARWLLASVGGTHDTVEEQTMAAVHTYERLRDHLGLFLGPQGFDALWTRALHLVRRTVPWDETHALSAVSAHRLDIVVRGRDPAEARRVLLAIFMQFLSLLFTFVGANLGFRLLQQYWPALPTPITNVYSEETPQ